MQIRTEGLVWQELDGDLVLMDLERSVYLTTNATGSVLAKLLTEERTREELADHLVEQFGIDRNERWSTSTRSRHSCARRLLR